MSPSQLRDKRVYMLDVGSLVPRQGAPTSTDCSNPNQAGNCEFVFVPDGQLDTGYYYAQAGRFSYDAFSMQLGVRYTF